MSILSLLATSNTVSRTIAQLTSTGDIEIGNFSLSSYQTPTLTITAGLTAANIIAMQFSPDNTKLAVVSTYGIYLYRVSDGALLYSDISTFYVGSFTNTGRKLKVDFTSNGNYLFYFHAPSANNIFNIKKLNLLTYTVSATTASTTTNGGTSNLSLFISADESKILCFYIDDLITGQLRVWDTATLATLTTPISGSTSASPSVISSFTYDKTTGTSYFYQPSTANTKKVLVYNSVFTLIDTITSIYWGETTNDDSVVTYLESRQSGISGFYGYYSQGLLLNKTYAGYLLRFGAGGGRVNPYTTILLDDAFIFNRKVYSGTKLETNYALSYNVTAISNY